MQIFSQLTSSTVTCYMLKYPVICSTREVTVSSDQPNLPDKTLQNFLRKCRPKDCTQKSWQKPCFPYLLSVIPYKGAEAAGGPGAQGWKALTPQNPGTLAVHITQAIIHQAQDKNLASLILEVPEWNQQYPERTCKCFSTKQVKRWKRKYPCLQD